MSKNQLSLPAIQLRKFRAWRLLWRAPLTYEELADERCIRRRYAEQVVQQLSATGFLIHSRTEHCRKHFWAAADVAFLPPGLTTVERAEVAAVLAGSNQPLQTAFYKLTQLLNAQ